MNLLTGLLKPSVNTTAVPGGVRVQLTLPPAARTDLEAQLQNLPLPQLLTVGPQNEDGSTPLLLGNGAVVVAKVSPPLAPGSQVTLTQLPSAVTGEVESPTVVTAQLTRALVRGAQVGQPAAATPPHVNMPQVAAAPALTLANVQVVGGQVQLALPNVLPQGPVLLVLPPQAQEALQALPPQTTLTLTPTGAGTADGQPVTLSGGGLTTPLQVTLRAGQPLPLLPVQVVTGEAGLEQVATLSQPLAFAPPAAAQAPAPAANQLAGLKVLFFGAGGVATPAVLPPAGEAFSARILTPPLPAAAVAAAGLPAGTVVQTAVLSTGQTVQLQLPGQLPVTAAVGGKAPSPTPLPAGTVLTMALDFTSTPVSNGPTVLRLQPANAQPQPNQPNPQPATPHTAVQTVQAPPPVGTLVQATVTGQTAGTPPQALLTLNTPPYAGQTFTLPTGQTLPVGTQVQLQFGQNLQATLLNFTLPPNFLRSQAATTLAHQWPMLTQVLHSMPQASQGQASGQIPTPMNFLATFLPYAKNLLTGQAEVPLGKDAALKAATLGLDFTPDLQLLTALAAKPESALPGQEQWRGVLFPYIENTEGDPRQGRFFWRQQKQEDERGESRHSTRFVLEFSLTQMGELQLDGLVNYPEIWLKLRGHKPFVPEMQAEISAVVTQTLEGLGLSGGITLEQTPTFMLNPLAELLSEDPTSLNLSL